MLRIACTQGYPLGIPMGKQSIRFPPWVILWVKTGIRCPLGNPLGKNRNIRAITWLECGMIPQGTPDIGRKHNIGSKPEKFVIHHQGNPLGNPLGITLGRIRPWVMPGVIPWVFP